MKITYDPDALPLSVGVVSRLISTAGVKNAAYRDLFPDLAASGFLLPGMGDCVTIEFAPVPGDGPPTATRPAASAGGMMGEGMMGGGMGMMGGGMMGPGRSAVPNDGGARQRVVFGELTVTLDCDEIPPWAEEYMAAVCARLRAALEKAWDSDLADLHQQAAEAEDEAMRAEGEVMRLFDQSREISAKARRADLSRDGVIETSKRLENEKQKLEMEMAGQGARRRALQEQIDKIAKDVELHMHDDSTLRDLEGAVRRLQENLKEAEQRLAESEKRVVDLQKETPQSGPVPVGSALADALARKSHYQGAVSGFQPKLMEATIQLNQVREAVSRAHGGDMLGKLNGELATLAIGTAEMEARLKFVEGELASLQQALEQADAYEMQVALQLPLAKKAYETAKLRQAELERRIRTLRPPNVVVLGGK